MPQVYQNKHVQAVRVFTDRAAFEGLVSLTLLGRLLDELNAASRVFLPLESPSLLTGDCQLADSLLSINKASILFAVEVDSIIRSRSPEVTRGSEGRPAPRAVLSLRVNDYRIEGYVRVVEGAEPIMRLQQEGRPFIALTSASIVGPEIEFATPFLAVNRNHILSVQETFRLSDVVVETESMAVEPSRT